MPVRRIPIPNPWKYFIFSHDLTRHRHFEHPWRGNLHNVGVKIIRNKVKSASLVMLTLEADLTVLTQEIEPKRSIIRDFVRFYPVF